MIATLDFFKALYGNAHAGQFYIWVKWPQPDGRGPSKTIWVNTLEQACDAVAHYDGQANIYFGVCTASRVKQSNQRAKAVDTCMMPGLWLDVDFASPHHKKANLPPDRDAALALINSVPLAPSILVESGGGFHAYWKFKTPLLFDTEVERKKAADLIHGWQDMYRAKYPGVDIDATHDLPRVLRVPGTKNLNSGGVCKATLIDGPVYDVTEFVPFVRMPIASIPSARPLPVTPASARDSAPSVQEHGDVCGYEFPRIPGRFLEGTARPRTPEQFDEAARLIIEDMLDNKGFRDVVKDTTLNGSDADIRAVRLYINKSINMNCDPTRQAAYDIISHIRHLPGRTTADRAKALRADYLDLTVMKVVNETLPLSEAKSRPKSAKQQKDSQAQQGDAEPPTPGKVKGDDSQTTPMDRVIKELGLPITNLTKYMGSDPQEYSIDVIMPDGQAMRRLHLKIQELQELKLFERRWVSATNRAVKVSHQGDWKTRVFNEIVRLFVEQDLPEEATEIGGVKNGLVSYLASTTIAEGRDDAMVNHTPFWSDVKGNRTLCFFFDRFAEYMMLHAKGDGMTSRRLAVMLNTHGVTRPVSMRFRVGDKTIKERAYPVPEDLIEALKRRSRRLLSADMPAEESHEEEAWMPEQTPPITH